MKTASNSFLTLTDTRDFYCWTSRKRLNLNIKQYNLQIFIQNVRLVPELMGVCSNHVSEKYILVHNTNEHTT